MRMRGKACGSWELVQRTVAWFEETGVETNGFRTLEQALCAIFPDNGYTFKLYLDARATFDAQSKAKRAVKVCGKPQKKQGTTRR
jgi:hypothetical protein